MNKKIQKNFTDSKQKNIFTNIFMESIIKEEREKKIYMFFMNKKIK